MSTGIFAPDCAACGGRNMLSSMSVFVLDDLCFNFRSLPPKEAMVAVVSKDMLKGRVWYREFFGNEDGFNRPLGALRSFVSCLIGDVVPELVRGRCSEALARSYPTFP
jgi:hypothetical protein